MYLIPAGLALVAAVLAGSTVGIVGEAFSLATKIDLVHVPYKGTVLAVADMAAGRIEMVSSDMVPAVPHDRIRTEIPQNAKTLAAIGRKPE